MRKIKVLIFSGLVFSGATHAAPVNQADLSAKCAAVANSALTLSAVTQSTTTQDNNNILSAFYLFSMFSGRRLGEDEFLKRYNFHQEGLAKQWKYDIVTKGAFRATLDFDGRLAGLMKPCSLISRNFESSKSPELKAIQKFVESDQGKHLAETLKAMLEPKMDDANSTKSSDDEVATQTAIKPQRKPSQDLKFIIVANSSYDDVAKACIDSYEHFDNAVLIGCNMTAYDKAYGDLMLRFDQLKDYLLNNNNAQLGNSLVYGQKRWERISKFECRLQGNVIGTPMDSSCMLEQINLRWHQIGKFFDGASNAQKIEKAVLRAVKDEVGYLSEKIEEKLSYDSSLRLRFESSSKQFDDLVETDCDLQQQLSPSDIYDVCYLEYMSLRVQQMRRYVDEQVPIEEQQLLQPTQ